MGVGYGDGRAYEMQLGMFRFLGQEGGCTETPVGGCATTLPESRGEDHERLELVRPDDG
jgi:hypothetical protein